MIMGLRQKSRPMIIFCVLCVLRCVDGALMRIGMTPSATFDSCHAVSGIARYAGSEHETTELARPEEQE